jgi:hypothetical protein
MRFSTRLGSGGTQGQARDLRRSQSYVEARAQTTTQYAGPMLGLPKWFHREQSRQVVAMRFSTRLGSGGTPARRGRAPLE